MKTEQTQDYVSEMKSSEKSTINLSESILVSATYNGNKKVAALKFYNTETKKIHYWYDNTDHKPYCLVKIESISDETINDIKKRPDIKDIENIKKNDLITDKEIDMFKIIATDPLAIGGGFNRKSIRDTVESWEADIKYYETYLYDKGFPIGAHYRIKESKIVPVKHKLPEEMQKGVEKTLEKAKSYLKKSIQEWAGLLSQPLPELRRLALDIEVVPEEENRIPDPNEAGQEVIAVSLVGSDGLGKVLVLRRKECTQNEKNKNEDFKTVFFDDEKDLLSEVFKHIVQYPFILTYNGDDFDLNYLYHRALKLKNGFKSEEIPISLGNNVAYVRPGIHIDLYKTFNNRSIQGYAFNNRYTDHTLNGVSKALLNEGKIQFEGTIGDLSYNKLAKYCYQDSKITYGLTSFSDDLLMKLLLVISRVAKMPIDDVARLSVSNWIRSMMYFEHRQQNALIPRRGDLEGKEQSVASEAIIKGKKYKGGIVVEPKSGVYFDVAVLDFASLYPSLIKVHNLSYETVRCKHSNCKLNMIPETKHWACSKRRGLTSNIIGSLRDIRVDHYKPLSKKLSLTKEERELAKVVSQALKVILNASYGVMGAEIYPLYYLPAADATAALGRYSITHTIEKCEELKINVIYGDTDSLFLKSPTENQVKTITRWAENDLGIELDLEKVYRYVAFSERKKNYLGVLPDGSVDVKGLTGKKSHTPAFIRKAFYETIDILSKVITEKDFESAREEIKTYLREKYLLLKNKEIPIEDLAFNIVMSKSPKSYTKTRPQHVKAAEILVDQGLEIKAGDIISFVKTTNATGVKPVALANIHDVDTKKYENYMRSTFDQILSSLGYDFDEIVGATKLEDFFW
ncbi:MAG TPA: DNA-directed DNA polymerase I [Nitrososphaerales archaeon]|nr:DNA-directed DNA polymerase I [Nitrososphaerales archaeon]